MLVSYKLLNKYVNIEDVNPFDLANLLTNAGVEVEHVRSMAQGSDLVIGYVLEAIKHPETDKLTVCKVDVGNNEILQICCGAPNVGQGQKVIVAKPGCKLEYAKVPVIKEVELKGVKSNGMICSLSEIGIADKFLTSAQLEGIEVLDESLEVGQEALKALGLDDYILDLSLTPNRSDLNSVYALAIEVAAILKRDVNNTIFYLDDNKDTDFKANVNTDKCSSFNLYEFKDVKVQESSLEIKNFLIASGITPVNNVVDLGNLSMIISGNPIHMYDVNKLESKTFEVKLASENTTFKALNDKEYNINKDDLVICNGSKIVAIAGIIGSMDSSIDENTTHIVIESAYFDHVIVRNMAKKFDLFSEASTRFSKIVNPFTLEYPIALLNRHLKATYNGTFKLNDNKYMPKTITVSHEKIESCLGIKIDLKDCVDILKALLFEVEIKDNTLSVKPPMYRKDIEIKEDLIEEIIRLYGYDSIESKLPIQENIVTSLSPIQQLVKHTNNFLVGQGLNEIISYQLSNKTLLDDFSTNRSYWTLDNPFSEEHKYFRDQLLSSMIHTLNYNKSYQKHDLSLFEISNVFVEDKEERHLSIGLTGQFLQNKWNNQKLDVDFYLLKGMIFGLLDNLGYTYGRYLIKEVESEHLYMHPTKSAYITMNNQVIGVFGQLHPKMANKYKLSNTYVASLNLSFLSTNVGKVNKYQKISLYPSVTRDLSLVLNTSINSSELVKVIKTGNNKIVKDVKIFDVYKGDNLEKDTYSISVSIKLADDNKTLTEEEINSCMSNIINNLETKLNASLRS